MSDPTDLLILRLEAAEVGNRELGREVHAALASDEFFSPQDRPFQNYTTSLDAALALAERVMPGCEVRMIKDTSGPGWASIGIVEAVSGSANSPALALCAAILRAQSAVVTGGRP